MELTSRSRNIHVNKSTLFLFAVNFTYIDHLLLNTDAFRGGIKKRLLNSIIIRTQRCPRSGALDS